MPRRVRLSAAIRRSPERTHLPMSGHLVPTWGYIAHRAVDLAVLVPRRRSQVGAVRPPAAVCRVPTSRRDLRTLRRVSVCRWATRGGYPPPKDPPIPTDASARLANRMVSIHERRRSTGALNIRTCRIPRGYPAEQMGPVRDGRASDWSPHPATLRHRSDRRGPPTPRPRAGRRVLRRSA
jgi:hypothetical protein